MRRVLTLVPDLFFAARIAETAQALGVQVEAIEPTRGLDQCCEKSPDLVIMDLHGHGEPLALVRELRNDERTKAIPIVGFYSHVDQALRQAALEAGVDHVLPRSAFTTRLPALLRGDTERV